VVGSNARYYDPNGNLVLLSKASDPDAVRQRFKYDAWNRLVRVQKLVQSPDTWNTCTYAYNGLNWRVREDRVVYPSPAAGPTERVRWEFYSPQWQQLMEVVHDPSAAGQVQSQEQQFWGMRGTDDAVYRRIDHAVSGTYDDSFYQ
jgi:YD repeat-containing protein